MGWMQLVNATIGHVLSWPVFGIVAVVVFRHQLAPLLRRITSYEGLGQKLTFGQELAKMEEEVDHLASSQPPGLRPTTPERPDPTGDPYLLLAEQAPSGAVLDAWLRVEKGAVVLAETYKIDDYLKGTYAPLPLARASARIVRELVERQVIPGEMVRVIERLRKLRNEVAHGVHEPTAGEATTYVATAREVWEILERLSSLASRDD